MKTISAAALAALALCGAAPAEAQARPDAAGSWKVTGSIMGRAVALTCRFTRKGAALGGACVEAAGGGGKPGETRPLTGGTVAGGQVSWSYKISMMLMTFDVGYTGTLSGNRIAGTITAAGRKGTFTAVRT